MQHILFYCFSDRHHYKQTKVDDPVQLVWQTWYHLAQSNARAILMRSLMPATGDCSFNSKCNVILCCFVYCVINANNLSKIIIT